MINDNVLNMIIEFYNPIWKKSLLAVAMLFIMTGSAFAQGLGNNSGSGAQLFCTRDYGNFITNGIDFDGEGFVDYWRDIIIIYNTNYCQYADIESLLNRIDKIRKQLRQAFYVCDTSTTNRLKQQYYQLSAELYYLRHFVETANSVNPKLSDKEKAQKVARRSEIRAEFLQRFVTDKGYFTTTEGKAIYLKISQKYAGKEDAYKNCTDPNLDQLMIRLKDLAGTMKTIENLGKRFTERTKRRFSAMKKRIDENPGLITAFSADSVGDFFKRVVDFRVNNEPVQDATVWEEISNTAKENAPFSYGDVDALPPLDFGKIAGDLDTIQTRETDNNLDLVYFAEYDLKYRQVQGLGLDHLKVDLDTLQETIKNTFDPLDRVGVCTANIVGKQCGG